MTNENIYEIWRPERSPWSRWVKPVIFAFLDCGDRYRDEYPVKDWQIQFQSDAAIIADLPGAEGISVGMALARSGFLPVPVYNACPSAKDSGETSPSILNTGADHPPVAVDMSGILRAICAATKELDSLELSAQAPPAFLLDGNREARGVSCGEGCFDNRSFVTPSDFPSAEYFVRHGISKIILLQHTSSSKADLLPVLLRLQKGGMTIATQAPWQEWTPRAQSVTTPMFIVAAWEWLRRKLGYRRDPFHGCFGGVVPPSSS